MWLFLTANYHLMTAKEKELLDEMLNTLQRIKDQTNYIDTHERIPQLELNAIVARVEKLYELSVALKYFHAHVDEMLMEQQQFANKKTVVEDESQVEEPADDDLVKQGGADVVEIKEKITENLVEDISSIPAESAHDKLSSNEDESVVNKLMLQPISDLKSAIGINDKFQFINELFAGNADEFNKNVDALNSAVSAEEAMSIVKSFNWSDNDVSKAFVNLIERRFL